MERVKKEEQVRLQFEIYDKRMMAIMKKKEIGIGERMRK